MPRFLMMQLAEKPPAIKPVGMNNIVAFGAYAHAGNAARFLARHASPDPKRPYLGVYTFPLGSEPCKLVRTLTINGEA